MTTRPTQLSPLNKNTKDDDFAKRALNLHRYRQTTTSDTPARTRDSDDFAKRALTLHKKRCVNEEHISHIEELMKLINKYDGLLTQCINLLKKK